MLEQWSNVRVLLIGVRVINPLLRHPNAPVCYPLGICGKRSKMKGMPAVVTDQMIRREISDDHICMLTFDRPDSGANIFDATTLDELNEHLDSLEKDACCAA